MRLVLERGVPQEERHKLAIGSLTDWDAARVFLEVVRCGSFRSAAERLDLSINVVRRRIDDFERQIGATLFTRDVHGTRLTDEGSLVVSAVERMEAASFDLLRAGKSVTHTLSGEVRVAVTEGLGTFWLAPRLVEFQQSFPNILVDLHCAMRSADVSRHEADVAIHLSRPAALDAHGARVFRQILVLDIGLDVVQRAADVGRYEVIDARGLAREALDDQVLVEKEAHASTRHRAC